jgi:hypothetical protein
MTNGSQPELIYETEKKNKLSTGDKIAIGIGVPVGIFTIIGAIAAYFTWMAGS